MTARGLAVLMFIVFLGLLILGIIVYQHKRNILNVQSKNKELQDALVLAQNNNRNNGNITSQR